jgi:hypothetical protein
MRAATAGAAHRREPFPSVGVAARGEAAKEPGESRRFGPARGRAVLRVRAPVRERCTAEGAGAGRIAHVFFPAASIDRTIGHICSAGHRSRAQSTRPYSSKMSGGAAGRSPSRAIPPRRRRRTPSPLGRSSEARPAEASSPRAAGGTPSPARDHSALAAVRRALGARIPGRRASPRTPLRAPRGPAVARAARRGRTASPGRSRTRRDAGPRSSMARACARTRNWRSNSSRRSAGRASLSPRT